MSPGKDENKQIFETTTQKIYLQIDVILCLNIWSTFLFLAEEKIRIFYLNPLIGSYWTTSNQNW